MTNWRGLIRVGAWSGLISVAVIVLQIIVFIAWPPPETAVQYFELLNENPLRGLLTLDLLYVVSNLLTYLFYLSLAAFLWRASRSAVVIAMAMGTLGMAAYMASLKPVEMLQLAHQYAVADEVAKPALLAVGESLLASWEGTAFDAYYVLNFVALVIFAILAFRSGLLGRTTAIFGLAAAVLMAVPSNFGIVGLMFALASLIPWSAFAVMASLRMLKHGDLHPVEN
ncbi:hypothetical protein [Neomicrococcus aestuarii]|uniref:DUF4386 domain-containing protein n=1 Tax=Neomicrococcus aestuarii TaxID=556325 RepID=A0A1L2ZQ00_9MICC|nr:hypothetical protein [Neomicrococcus aestuarii]APF41072.1 hypothetical protein BHE16_08760 [Neomicrococcus aestuarii]